MRLFAVLVGGKHDRALIELHDVLFVVAESIEAATPSLRRRWWGTPGSLHIDAYAEIDTLDGYKIEPVPSEDTGGGGLGLYFVNTGGYRAGVFGEDHAYSFHVGADLRTIWAIARSRAQFGQKHQDNFDPVDDVISVDEALKEQAYKLRFTPANGAPDNVVIHASYKKLSG